MKHKNGKLRDSIVFKMALVIFFLAVAIVVLLFAFSLLLYSTNSTFNSHSLLFVVLIAVVIVIFVIGLLVMHHYLRPVKQLIDGVNEIRKGNLNFKIKVKSKDEFGQLANAFNFMTSDLDQMIKSKEQLLLDVSHELRTPLTNSKLAVEMLPESDEKKSIQCDIQEMNYMINELLESARLNSSALDLDIKETAVSDIINKTLQRFFSDNARINVAPISRNIRIKVDEYKVITVIKNLIDNSLKYSNSEKQIEILVIDNDENVIIQIEDQGQYIPEEKLSFLFEPFYKIDKARSNSSGSYGLGLHICKRITELHSAKLIIENNTNIEGVIAKIVFPKNA